MSTIDIKKKTQNIIDNFSKDNQSDFIFELLRAYGIPKSTVTRLRKGDLNRSKTEGEILFAKKVIFRTEPADNLLSAIDDIGKDEKISKFSPRFAIIADYDYTHLVAKDLKLGKSLDIALHELPQHYDFFLPLAGSEVYNTSNDNEADRNAAYKMAVLYDHLKEDNPDIYQSAESIHQLNVFLSRLLFCFFAEDTGIFSIDSIFTDTLAQHTDDSGRDTHTFLNNLFERFNTPDDSQRFNEFPAFLQQFPYVNGGLFKDEISSPNFSSKSRKILIELGELQWKNINPDIFGSMIQAVTTGADRDQLNKHYTSVPNIKKLINPAFLDELYFELEKAKTVKQLYRLQNRIAEIKFFDPACGSGNFLIITYKELRLLEIKLFKKVLEIENYTQQIFSTRITLSQFYGIEIDDFAHEITMLSLWLAEHQMNVFFEEQFLDFAQINPILPLKQAGRIIQDNATRIDWRTVCPIDSDDEVYVIGNPPYEGSRDQNENQKDDLRVVFEKNYKSLDYVCAWFYKGAQFIEKNNAKYAFVSTNSICQGSQVALLWKRIFEFDIEIDFAYQSFKWKNNAKGNAGVTVIIVSLRNKSSQPKYLFIDKFQKPVKNINGYLSEGSDFYIKDLSQPISNIKPMMKGNAPIDNGNFLFPNEKEAEEFKNKYPKQAYLVREFIGSAELINNKKRFCLWLKDASKKDLTENSEIIKRVANIKAWREKSPKAQTRKYAEKPTLFMEDRQPNSDYLMIPVVSSERREYIPIDNLGTDIIANYSSFILPDTTTLEFAIISSKMHMTWVRAIGGRLKTDYRYSAKLCYNTFPFPPIDVKQKENLSQYVFDILEARANHVGKTLAWMYDPDTMPSDLKQAHQALDKAVEQCYRLAPFDSDSERLEYLFKLYEKMIAEENNKAKAKPKKTK